MYVCVFLYMYIIDSSVKNHIQGKSWEYIIANDAMLRVMHEAKTSLPKFSGRCFFRIQAELGIMPMETVLRCRGLFFERL